MTTATMPSPLYDHLRQHLARGTSDLPTLPRSVTEALRLARNASLDFDELSRVAANDPPLAARIISVANSATYARAGMPRTASVRLAAVRLGTQATRDVLYQVAYASMFVDAPKYGSLIEETFTHGVRVARSARLLARERGLDPDVAFLAGLLHDIGRARCWKLLAAMRENLDMTAAHSAVTDLHMVAGAELAVAWHLPFEVVEACRWHHDPGRREHSRVIAAADRVAHFNEGRATAADAQTALLDAGVPAERVAEVTVRLLAENGSPR